MQNHKKVIPFPSVGWRFFDFLQGSNNPIEDWYQGLSEAEQDLFDGLLKDNQKIEHFGHWGGFKWLQGACRKEKLWEWRFKVKVQQRAIGVFGGNRKEVVFVMGCYHKQGVYTPANALTTAIDRAKAVNGKVASVRERKIKENI